MLEHPHITLSVDHLSEQDLLLNGFIRADHNGDNPDIVYLCYKKTDRIVRITIVSNPYLTLAKQEQGETFILKAVPFKDARRCANEAIIKFGTNQNLYGCYTIRQALLRIHTVDKTYNIKQLETALENYNKSNYTSEHIYFYGNKKYISKNVVNDIVDYIDLCNFRKERYNER